MITSSPDITRTHSPSRPEHLHSRKRKHFFSGYYVSAEHKKTRVHTTSFFSERPPSGKPSRTYNESAKPHRFCPQNSGVQGYNKHWKTSRRDISPPKQPMSDSRYEPYRRTKECNRHLTRLRSTLSGSSLSMSAEAYVETMLEQGILPDQATCAILLTIYAETGEFEKAERLVFGDNNSESYLDEWQVPVSIKIYNAYLGVCAKTRQAAAAQRVVDILKDNVRSRQGILPDEITCVSLLSYYAGRPDKCLYQLLLCLWQGSPIRRGSPSSIELRRLTEFA